MAGNFILKSITASDLIVAKNFPEITWSTVAHKKGDLVDPTAPLGERFQGWTSVTRQELSRALSGQAIPNRKHLPPHRYLEIKTWGALSVKTQQYLVECGWVDSLIRPDGAGLSLKALPNSARLAWDAGNKALALKETLVAGPVSIEIFYQSGLEIS